MNIHSRVWPSRGDWVGCKMDPEASKRHRRAMSAVVRRPSSSLRPGTARSGASAKPRARPYSAYSERGADQDQTPKFDHPATNREWWRYYLKVSKGKITLYTRYTRDRVLTCSTPPLPSPVGHTHTRHLSTGIISGRTEQEDLGNLLL